MLHPFFAPMNKATIGSIKNIIIMKKQNRYKFKLKKEHMEVNKLPSRTIQGDSYTIKELLEKHTTGILPEIERKGQYPESVNFDDIDYSKVVQMDIVDQQYIKTNVQITLDQMIEDVENEQKQQQKQTKEVKDETTTETKSNDDHAQQSAAKEKEKE